MVADRHRLTHAATGSHRQNVPTRRCDRCDAQMIHLSDLPSYMGMAPVRIFRCDGCHQVTSEDW